MDDKETELRIMDVSALRLIDVEHMKAAVQLELSLFRSLIYLNAGAVLVILTFIANAYDKFTFEGAYLILSIICYIIGLISACIANWCSFNLMNNFVASYSMVQHSIFNTPEEQHNVNENVIIHATKSEEQNKLSQNFISLSVLGFSFGSIFALIGVPL